MTTTGLTTHNGNVVTNGTTTQNGNVNTVGSVNVTGNITASGTIKSQSLEIESIFLNGNDLRTELNGLQAGIDHAHRKIDQIGDKAYRGVAIALATQQQVPNIGAGQLAVFGGIGHYEGESAGALGIASVFEDGRTSINAALGVAGGGDIGGRVGIAYVFGGK